MLDVCLLVKYLDEVEIAVVGFLQLVQGELEIDISTYLGKYIYKDLCTWR